MKGLPWTSWPQQSWSADLMQSTMTKHFSMLLQAYIWVLFCHSLRIDISKSMRGSECIRHHIRNCPRATVTGVRCVTIQRAQNSNQLTRMHTSWTVRPAPIGLYEVGASRSTAAPDPLPCPGWLRTGFRPLPAAPERCVWCLAMAGQLPGLSGTTVSQLSEEAGNCPLRPHTEACQIGGMLSLLSCQPVQATV